MNNRKLWIVSLVVGLIFFTIFAWPKQSLTTPSSFICLGVGIPYNSCGISAYLPGTGTPTPTPSGSPSPTPTPTAAPSSTPTPMPTAILANLMSYYKNLDSGALATINSATATAAPDGFKYSPLTGYVKYVDAGVQSGSSDTLDHIKAAVPYLGPYMDIMNSCSVGSAGSVCNPDVNPEGSYGQTMNTSFFEVASNGARILNNTQGFAINQSTTAGSGTGAACGAGSHTYTATTAQNDCTLNPAVPLPTASPVSFQKDPNLQNQRYRANVETQSTVVLTEANRELTVLDGQYLASTGHASTSPYNFTFNDDSFDPGDSASYPQFYSWGNKSFGNTGFSLAGITTGYPYPNYNHTQFLTGFGAVIAGESKPVIFNTSGYQPDGAPGGADGVALPAPPSSILACTSTNTNCMGAMQENTFDNQYQSNNQPTADKNWASNMNAYIFLQNNGKDLVDYEHATLIPAHTFSAAVTTGSHTIAVNNVVGIDPGATFTTATNAETVTVTAVGVNQITATFTKTHTNGSGFTVADNGNDPGGLWVRRYMYASLMLGMDHPEHTILTVDYPIDAAFDLPDDGIPLPVEAEIVAYGAIKSEPSSWSASSPTTTGVYALEDTTQASGTTYACGAAGGLTTGVNCAYVREFANCYKNGTLMGSGTFHGCAAVVMPNNGGTYKFPTLTQTYGHTLTITNFTIHPGLGDSGSLSLTGAAPPLAGTLESSPNSWILTP